MHFSALTPVEQRVLGCLIEKRWTTPDQYPLSLNSLRLAANQSTNRDPVTRYEEGEIRDAAQRLSVYGLARLASGAGSRAIKYRHLAEEGLGLDRTGLAVLAVLLLRGPQTVGEIKQRTERMAPLASLDDAQRALDELVERDYAERLERRPGQKEERYRHRLGEVDDEAGSSGSGEASGPAGAPAASTIQAAASPAPTATVSGGVPGTVPGVGTGHDPAARSDQLEARVAALEGELARVETLEGEVARLRRQLDELLG